MRLNKLLAAMVLLLGTCSTSLAQDAPKQDTRARAAAYVSALFKRYDTNSDGILDTDELTKITRSLKLLNGDSNGDGVINRQEALNFVAGVRPEDAPAPAIDGLFDDWTDAHIVARDPVGDATGAFDIKNVSAVLTKEKLFIKLELAKRITLQNGLPEDGTLLLKILSDHTTLLGEDSSREIIIDFRKRTALFYPNDHVSRGFKAVGWLELGFNCLPGYSSDNFELCVDAINLNDVEAEVEFLFGSDYVKPFKVKQVSEFLSHKGESFTRADAADFRIANLNTLQNGLADAKRQDKFKRLFEAADADVYCFQEEWESDKFREGTRRIFSGDYTSRWSGGCAIVTELPMQPLAMTLDRAVAGLVEMSPGHHVAVISAHFKCCGYAGSSEDNLRIQQAELLIGEIKRMREGAFGEEAKDAGVVLIGDYNLVGSRKPLDIFNEAGLADVLMRCPSDGSAYTWRGLKPDESFWPGRLDLVSHDSRLEPLKGLILDTGRMTKEQMDELGLKADDSRASDHLMLLGDFRIRK